MCMAGSLCSALETVTTLLIEYSKIKVKKTFWPEAVQRESYKPRSSGAEGMGKHTLCTNDFCLIELTLIDNKI